jgi:hypothetical protein
MTFDFLSNDFWRLALPISTLIMAFASALFGFLSWRAEGSRRQAEARRVRLEATIDDLAELFAAVPFDRTKWDASFTQTFVEKLCKVDFKLDDDNPHAKPLVTAIQKILPQEHKNRDGEHMGFYNAARSTAKDYLDHEWKKFKAETGTKD